MIGDVQLSLLIMGAPLGHWQVLGRLIRCIRALGFFMMEMDFGREIC